MRTSTCVVDNRVLLLGLDELYRERMKQNERGELLACARTVCEILAVSPRSGPVEGYYTEDESLTEYFQRMRALQDIPNQARPRVEHLPQYQRLLQVTSSRIFGEPQFRHKLLPAGLDSLSSALESTFPNWNVDSLTSAAHQRARKSDDFSLVGLAALAKDPLLITALRETSVLYALVAIGAAPTTIKVVYEWAVDPVLSERAQVFISTFNGLFGNALPAVAASSAEIFWNAADESALYGRCVRLGYDDSIAPPRQYHWALAPSRDGLVVRDFWSTELWTTERFREALMTSPETLPF